jgi:hypothetical protein
MSSVSVWALAYAAYGFPIFPVSADKTPLVEHGFKDASTDSGVIKGWWRRYPFPDPAWALPPNVVVADLDEKRGKHGLVDFERLEGVDPRDVVTPIASTPSGGMQLFFDAAGKTYGNKIVIGGTGIDVRTLGGYVVLPAPNNGREWIRRLSTTPMLPAPAWLACAVKQPPRKLAAAASIPSNRSFAFQALRRACAIIIAAERGSRDETRHRQCFAIGALISAGVLDYEIALGALCAAAQEMVGADDWPNLDARVEYSVRRGMEQSDG